MNSTSSQNFADIPSDCKLAAAIVLNPYSQFCRIALILFNIGSFVQIIPLSIQYRVKRITLHGNLKLIYLNIVLMDCIVAPFSNFLTEFRHLYLSMAYHDEPCQMLTPLWFIIVTKVIAYAYVVAIPLLHFVAIVERIRATLLAPNYEFEGIRFGVTVLTIVYTFTLCFCGYLTYTALLENGFSLDKSFPAITFTNKYNAILLIVLYYTQLAVVLITAAGSYLLLRLNRTRDNISHRFNNIAKGYSSKPLQPSPLSKDGDTVVEYSLSKNFQLRENLQTMALIFPLDLAYFIFLTLHILLVVMLRTLNEQNPQLMSIGVFMAHYDLIVCIPIFYSILALIYYRRFLVNKNQPLFSRGNGGFGGSSNSVVPANSDLERQAEIYFKQLKSQWD